MASRAGFSTERLQRFGSEAVKRERRKQEISHAVTISCEYVGVATSEESFDASLHAQAGLHVGFEWRVAAHSYEKARRIAVRCDNLASRGATFPSGWQVALQSLGLDDIVDDTVKRVAAESGTASLRCQLLGQPLHVQLSEEHDAQGSIVVLNGFEHVLCAQVIDEEWPAYRGLCHLDLASRRCPNYCSNR